MKTETLATRLPIFFVIMFLITVILTMGMPRSLSAATLGTINEDNGEVAAIPVVPMASGGIGDDEMDNLNQIQSQYNLKLLFTESNGMYLSDVAVHIFDAHGNIVVDTVTNGPILLLKLPQGSYTVTARKDGEVKHEKAFVVSSLSSHQLRFSSRDMELF